MSDVQKISEKVKQQSAFVTRIRDEMRNSEGDQQIRKVANDVIYLPKTLEPLYPILASVPLQLFAYHIAVTRGCDVDKPRNLAKSVTVE